MDKIFIILVSLSLGLLLKAILKILKPINTPKLPPGPLTIPIIGNFRWLKMSFFDLEPIVSSLHTRFGPILTLRIGFRPAIFVCDRSLTYQALVQNGALFADRPPATVTGKIVSTNQHTISSSSYGQTWRLLRRNLTSEILHPSRVESYSHARKWVIQILINRLTFEQKYSSPTTGFVVVEHLRYAMFCLLVLLCFGDKLGEEEIKRIEEAQQRLLLNMLRYNILNLWPRLTRFVFKKRWEEFMDIRRNQEKVLIPLIRARKEGKPSSSSKQEEKEEEVLSYVDTLFNVELPEEGERKLNEQEIVSLCSEFLDGGTDTTTTALEWIMANLVKYPHIQEKLYMEIKQVVEDSGEDQVKEEDLKKMPFLKAVVLEGLRRHPPSYYTVPHAVTEDTMLGNYLVPKFATVNFKLVEMGWDPKVWEDPMSFKPERFLANGEAFDITGSKELKMIPFGVGRRMCPGFGLAMLHLEYFIANLVWVFKWKSVDGHEVDLSEKFEFTVRMKNPLRATLSLRKN